MTISFEITSHLRAVDTRSEKIYKINQTSDQNKDHGYDDISVRMTELCGSSIINPLQLFNTFMKGVSLTSGKRLTFFLYNKK